MSAPVPTLIKDYFGEEVADGAEIVQTFTPGCGWVDDRHPVTTETVNALHRAGVVGVSVQFGDRTADFDLDEVKYVDRERPVFGGNAV